MQGLVWKVVRLNEKLNFRSEVKREKRRVTRTLL